MWQQPLWGGASYSNLGRRGRRGHQRNGDRSGSCCGGFQTAGFQGATKRKTDTYQFAVGGSYDAGPLKITADLARTDSTFTLRTESVDYLINREDYQVDWFTGRPGGSGPTFQIDGLDFSDPANYNYRGFFEEYLTAKGKDWQCRIDAEYRSGSRVAAEGPGRFPLRRSRRVSPSGCALLGCQQQWPLQHSHQQRAAGL